MLFALFVNKVVIIIGQPENKERQNLKQLLVLLLFVDFILCQNPTNFILKSSECLTVGPNGNNVTSFPGTPWKANCKINGSVLTIESIDLETGKVIDKSDYEYIEADKVGIASSASGNVKYLFDYSEMKFYQGQVNLVFDKGMILTKNCVGQIVLK